MTKDEIREIAELTDAIKNDLGEAKKQSGELDPERVYLWADPDREGVYYDQPPGNLPGYRKAKKYTEADKRELERAIGEDVQVIRTGKNKSDRRLSDDKINI